MSDWLVKDDIDHMRRVVAYCKRHLAQGEKAKQNTDSKSYKSLKNWGHDALKNWIVVESSRREGILTGLRDAEIEN